MMLVMFEFYADRVFLNEHKALLQETRETTERLEKMLRDTQATQNVETQQLRKESDADTIKASQIEVPEPAESTTTTEIKEEPRPRTPVESDILDTLKDESSWKYPEIDVVYTWVNGSDPVWQIRKKKYHHSFLRDMMGHTTETQSDSKSDQGMANGNNRYRDHQELRYSIRSVLKNAPWVRKIHLVVSDGQVPSWLNIKDPKINIVKHSAIFKNKTHLPTFNSNAIESNICNIPGLSDYFWYFNDDVFLGNKVTPAELFVSKFHGQQKRFEETWIVRGACSKGCSSRKIGNGQCDAQCNNADCGWDQGDCGLEAVRAGKEKISKELRSGRFFKLGSGDFFTEMRYADSVFNRDLKPPNRGRHVIRHVPHLFNKKIILDMKRRFHEAFEWTSEHRFRHPEDMQFAFSYFHYIDVVRVYAPSKRQAWRAALESIKKQSPVFLYVNEPAQLDRVELERYKNISSSKPFSILKQCATQLIQNKKPEMENCDKAMDSLLDDLNLRLPIVGTNVNAPARTNLFVMIGDNKANSLMYLRQAAASRAEFITINDDMTKYIPEVEKAYHDMFTKRFPAVSSLEKVS